MYFRIHLNSQAPDGPSNMLLWRDIIFNFKFRHEKVFEQALKKPLDNHFSVWISPSNVALNVHSKSPAFQL